MDVRGKCSRTQSRRHVGGYGAWGKRNLGNLQEHDRSSWGMGVNGGLLKKSGEGGFAVGGQAS